MLIFNKRGQSLIEYSTLISLVIAVCLAMQVYIQRGWGGAIRVGINKLKKGPSGTEQYEPYYIQSAQNIVSKPYTETEEMKANGEVIRESTDKTTVRSGYQKILPSP